jgi:hypothetical protein
MAERLTDEQVRGLIEADEYGFKGNIVALADEALARDILRVLEPKKQRSTK